MGYFSCWIELSLLSNVGFVGCIVFVGLFKLVQGYGSCANYLPVVGLNWVAHVDIPQMLTKLGNQKLLQFHISFATLGKIHLGEPSGKNCGTRYNIPQMSINFGTRYNITKMSTKFN